jgi:DNA-binding transcriptional LysR family regulator
MARSTLEQWRMLKAVVDHGGFAQAAEAIHKSQSTINHAVHKLQNQLGLQLLEVVGRKAQLTPTGASMLRRAELLLDQSEQLEKVAASLAGGVEPEVRVAVDEVFPPPYLASALETLSTEYPHTRVQLFETVLSGGAEQLLAGEVDLLLAGLAPAGFIGDPLLRAEFIAVARCDHPLLQFDRPLQPADLAAHRQVVLRDSARANSVDAGWLGAEQRWTVTHVATSLDIIARGMGFAWLPASRVAAGLRAGTLRELPLERGSRRYVELYLTFADRDRAGPACRRLGELLAAECRRYGEDFNFADG